MKDHRRSRRHQIPLQVALIHKSTAVLPTHAKDLSDEYLQLDLSSVVTGRSILQRLFMVDE